MWIFFLFYNKPLKTCFLLYSRIEHESTFLDWNKRHHKEHTRKEESNRKIKKEWKIFVVSLEAVFPLCMPKIPIFLFPLGASLQLDGSIYISHEKKTITEVMVNILNTVCSLTQRRRTLSQVSVKQILASEPVPQVFFLYSQ